MASHANAPTEAEIREHAKEIVKGLISGDLKTTNHHKQEGKAKQILDQAMSQVEGVIEAFVKGGILDKTETADSLAIRAIALVGCGTRA